MTITDPTTDPAVAPTEDDEQDPTTEAPTEAPAEDEEPDNARRPRGFLESDVRRITDLFVTGELVLPEGASLTPHYIGQMIKKLDAIDAAPSTGAVTAVLKRWVDYGFIVASEGPFAFEAYTEAAINDGLAELKAQHSARRKAERAAAKEAQAAPAI